MAKLNWKPDIPIEHRGEGPTYLDAADAGEYVYSLRGWPGKYFIVRMPIEPGELARTKFFPNVAAADEVFKELVS